MIGFQISIFEPLETADVHISTTELDESDDSKCLVQMVSNFMPIIIEAFLYDIISQKNSLEYLKKKLRELQKN